MPIEVPTWLTGIATEPHAPNTDAPASVGPAAASAEPGTVAAAVLMDVWAGRPVTVISAPPGGGKTHLVTTIAAQLATNANLNIAIASQTNSQVTALAWRITPAAPTVPIRILTRRNLPARQLPTAPNLATIATTHEDDLGHGAIVLGTTHQFAGARARGDRWIPDVLIVDEAGQLTLALYRELDGWAHQVVAVGDPGQLPPVVTGDTSAWQAAFLRPEAPLLTTLLTLHPTTTARWQLPSTWRLGPATTALVQPTFYDGMAFTSTRPATRLAVDGADLPELARITTSAPPAPAAPSSLTPAADRARYLLNNANLITDDGPRPLTPADIAIIAPHRVQVALLRRAIPDGVTVLTTEQSQGLEWPAVIVVHPLTGHRDLPEFNLSPERLCVALSRHTAHLSLVTASHIDHALATADPAVHGVTTHRSVLDALDARYPLAS